MFCKDKYTAEDVLQDTFISIYESTGSYRIFSNPKAWILTIVKNKALNIIKKDSRMTSIETLENDDANIIHTKNPENLILDKIHADMLLSALSEEDKKIVILHAVYEFKHREIAEFMGLPLGTVKWRYKQSIDKMKTKANTAKQSDEVFNESNKQKEVSYL